MYIISYHVQSVCLPVPNPAHACVCCLQCIECVQWPQLPSRVRLMTIGLPGSAPVLSVSYANHAAQVCLDYHSLPFPSFSATSLCYLCFPCASSHPSWPAPPTKPDPNQTCPRPILDIYMKLVITVHADIVSVLQGAFVLLVVSLASCQQCSCLIM